jgi:RNA polymerase sigma factor (sigma-70 family)
METHPNKTDRYYAVCLRNEYIRLAKVEDKYLSLPEQWQGATETDFMRAEFHTLLEGLTEKQKEVLMLRFVWRFTVDEIAKIQKISRQAVNQTVNRALRRIRKNTRPENVVDISKRVL